MKDKLDLKNKGFTIIEVMIVLAIAGVIMLIVFLAVPALQRNSRNTQYRAEAGQILSAATEWSTNNGGKKPVGTDNAAIMGLVKTQHITDLTVEAHSGTAVGVDLHSAVLRTGARCLELIEGNSEGEGATYSTESAGGRSLALIFPVENASGKATPVCQES